MTNSYGQYCPLALAAELLCRRWTVLIVSRLVDGCTRFNEIQRGVPRISPSLLSQRLHELEDAGLVRRRRSGRGYEYLVTESGRELVPIIDHMAVWGQRWARDMSYEDLDPAFLAWSMHLRLNTDDMPPGRTVLRFKFDNAPRDLDEFWLVNEDGRVDMCLKDPGFEVDLHVLSDLKLFIEAWRGFRDLHREIRAGRIRLHGPTALRQRFPGWLLLSGLAVHPRRRAGSEKRLAARRA